LAEANAGTLAANSFSDYRISVERRLSTAETEIVSIKNTLIANQHDNRNSLQRIEDRVDKLLWLGIGVLATSAGSLLMMALGKIK
jgi:hypothetical protein